MKRRVLLTLAVLCAGIAWADLAQGQVARVKVVVNGKEIQETGLLGRGKQLPLLPAEAVCKGLGIDYFFDKIGNAVVAVKGDSTLYSPIGKHDAIVSGEGVTPEEPSLVQQGIAYVHAALLQKAFGLDLNWSEAGRVLEIRAEAGPPTAPGVRLLKDILAEKPGQKAVRVLVDGKELSGEMAMEGEKLLAPLNVLAPALGCTVIAGSVEGSTVFALKAENGTTADLAADSEVVHVTNLAAEVVGASEPKEVKLPTPCRMVGGEMYVPVAGTVELVGATWVWNQEEKAVQIYSGTQPPPPPPASLGGSARLMSAILAEKPGLKPVRLTVDGLELPGELAIEEGRLLAPVSALAEELGWKAEVEQTVVTLTRSDGAKVRLEVGSPSAQISDAQGQVSALDLVGPPRVLGANVVYAPVAGLVEALGGTRAWDEGEKTAQVFTAGVSPPDGVKPAQDAAGLARMVSQMGVAKPPRIAVDGKEAKVALAMEGGRLLAPVHVLANGLGWEWKWRSAAEAAEGAVGIRRRTPDAWLYFSIGSKVVKDDREKALATPTRFLKGMVYVPVADFVEVVGASWVWDKDNKVVNIKRPRAPEAATKIGDILGSPGLYSGRLVFVVGKCVGREAQGVAGLPAKPPTSPQDWILEDDTAAIYVAYDQSADVTAGAQKGQEVALWGLVRLTADSEPYLEPGLADGHWELVPES